MLRKCGNVFWNLPLLLFLFFVVLDFAIPIYIYENGSLHIAELWLSIAHWLDRPVSTPALYILSS